MQLLQLMPEPQAPEGLQLGTSDPAAKLLKIIGNPCVSCSPDLPEHNPDLDQCEGTSGKLSLFENLSNPLGIQHFQLPPPPADLDLLKGRLLSSSL